MSKVLVTGAEYRDKKLPEWFRGERAVVLAVDLESGSAERVFEYVSPPEVCADDYPGIVFKAGTLDGDTFYLCTQTEILVRRLPSFEPIKYHSLPCFNDVHHVAPRRAGGCLVANTGLDMVVALDELGELAAVWGVLGEDPWERFSADVDYRKVPTTKPHHSHPNFVFEDEAGEIWATRMYQRDAYCVTRPELSVNLGGNAGPHDGCEFMGERIFTSVDGCLIFVDLQQRKILRRIDLNNIYETDYRLGWCRGVLSLDQDRALVGFSRLRPTKIRKNLQWLSYKVGVSDTMGALPTRMALIDLTGGAVVREYPLEQFDFNVLFSIHHFPDYLVDD